MRICTTLILLLSLVSPLTAQVFIPPGAGVLNVRDPAYGAKGDGQTDDTAAIQKALSEALDSHRIVYLPAGTYVVSDTLKWWREGYNLEHVNGWGAFLQFQGDGRDRTIIRLADNAAGFDDAEKPKPVIATGSRGYHGKKRYKQGEGNEAFENNLRDFTVDVGASNPGAVGIDYQVSNSGAMRGVTIRAPKGSGAIGLDLRRRDNGPGLVTDVRIEGFDIGITAQQVICQMLFEHITLVGQRSIGVENTNGILAFRSLGSQNTVPAVRNMKNGFLTLIDSKLEGGDGQSSAVVNVDDDSVLIVRNLRTSGYVSAINSRDERIKGNDVARFTSDSPLAVGKSEAVELPIEETPIIELSSNASEWAGVAKPDGRDVTDEIQAALDSGKPFVYLGAGRALISRPLVVPASVRAIVGFGVQLDSQKLWDNDQPMIRVDANASEPLLIDRMTVSGRKNRVIEHASNRPIVLRDQLFFGGRIYRNTPGSGPLFVENVAGAGYELNKTRLWGRNWNTEGPPNRIISSDVWALGFKHEGKAQFLTFENGSRFEGYAGFIYTFGKLTPETVPIVFDASSRASISFANHTFVASGTYPVQLKAGERLIERADLFSRGGGVIAPMIVINK